MPRIPLSRSIALFGIAAAVFFYGLGSAKLWDRDEPRNSRASHEMLERGDWVVPTFNGQLRDHKPVLLYWGQMISYLSLGESEFTARLPSAIAGLLSVLAVAVLASRLSGLNRGISQEGFWAGCVLATCLLFVMAARAATPDALLISFSTIGIAALVIGSLAPSPPYSVGRVGKTKWRWAVIGYASLGLAALAKGPVGIILPLAVVFLWWLICFRFQNRSLQRSPGASKPSDHADSTKNAKQTRVDELIKTAHELWRTLHPLQCLRAMIALRAIPGLVCTLCIAVPWYVLVGLETDGAFLRGFFLDHNLGRAVQSMEGHSGGVLFYPATLLVGTFPWSLWLLPMLLWCKKSFSQSALHRQTIILGAVWVGVYVAAFSCASTKLPSYITPCYAGMAVAFAGFLKQFESRWALPAYAWRRFVYVLTCVIGICISAGIVSLSVLESMPWVAAISICGAALCFTGLTTLWLDRREQVHLIPACWLVAAAVFHMSLFGLGTQSVDQYRNEVDALTAVDRRWPSENWLTVGGMEPSWVHYLDRTMTEIHEPAVAPVTWDKVREYVRQHPDARIVVTGSQIVESLQRQGGAANLPLECIASSPRFLRSDRLAVFRYIGSDDSHMSPRTDKPAAARVADSHETRLK